MLIYQYVVVRLERTYGNLRAVPVGPMAQAFARIAGSKTLTPVVLREIMELGLSVAADGSSQDRAALEYTLNGTDLRAFHPVVPHRPGMEDELTSDMQAHLDNKAEHGT